MLHRRFDNPWILSVLAGTAVFLSFPKFNFFPASLAFAFFFLRLSHHFRSLKGAFAWGLFVSFILLLGGFYWITYVIHVFGFMPWIVAGLLFLGFCLIGALNFPLFAVGLYLLRNRRSSGFFYAVICPALFVVIEGVCPKLFPWQLGHCLYRAGWINQIAEITGASLLSFIIVGWGSVFYGLIFSKPFAKPLAKRCLAVPAIITSVAIIFSIIRLGQGPANDSRIKVAIIQANIGSLDRLGAQLGYAGKLKAINEIFTQMTNEAMALRPDLLVWPETALAYRVESKSPYAAQITEEIKRWKVPLITGAYGPGEKNPWNEFNSAYLIEPDEKGKIRFDHYNKNVLLAFGEYMPFGEWFPELYRKFPQVSNFERGTTQKAFELDSGTRIGISICYEMILPEFMRKVAAQGVHLFVNLTNDSWFGPTSEPYLHGAISVFRAIEHRVPIIRSTNTGTSFVVNTLGQLSEMTPVYSRAILLEEVGIPREISKTFYGRWGEWFIALCAVMIIVFMMLGRRRNEAVHS